MHTTCCLLSKFQRRNDWCDHADKIVMGTCHPNYTERDTQQQIAKAVEVFSEGLLLPTYFKDGQTKTIKASQELAPLIRSGFMLRQVEGKFFISRGLLGGFPPTEVENQLKNKPCEQKSVFLSYQWDSSSLVDTIEKELQGKGYLVIRDKRDLKYGDELKAFMRVINHPNMDYVVSIISDKYLKSPNCMYEMTQIVKRYNFADTLLPCVVDGTNIYGTPLVLQPYIDHWATALSDAKHSPNPDSDYIQLLEEIGRKFKEFIAIATGSVSVSSTELLSKSCQPFFDRISTSTPPLELKLKKHKEKCLNDEEILKDLACYISVLGSRSVFDAKERTFDLDQKINEFLSGNVEVFLLLGNAGSGKSTYLRFLENRLWQSWQPDMPIPLFINLPGLNNPYGGAIEETLSALGFNPSEQKVLQGKYQFLFLFDGYDELHSHDNLYDSNGLKNWRAKALITCRTQHLYGNQSSYYNYFAPDPDNVISTTAFEEASIAPFNRDQIKGYCIRFIAHHKISWTWEQYQSGFASMTDVEEMIENPFLLRIIAETLPAKVGSQSHEQSKLFRIEFFDAFVKKWFDREERRLMRMNTSRPPNLKESFTEFARELGLEMVKRNAVSFEHRTSLFDDRGPGPWDKFFKPSMDIIRSGMPLRKIGEHSYAFIQKILRDYFCARAILPDRTFVENKLEHLFSRESDVIRFLADCVMKDPSLESKLLALVRGNNPTVAANAITILNAAKVNLSKENFSKVKIPGANLSGANLSGINFSDADLQGVDFSEAFLDHARMASSQMRGVELGQKPIITAPHKILTVSSDGSWVVCRDLDGSVYVWDSTAKQQRCRIEGHTGTIQTVVISSNGERALSGGDDKTVRLWNCENGRELKCFSGHEKKVVAVALSKDGRKALSGGEDGTIRLWNCEDGHLINLYSAHQQSVHCVAISSDGSWALSGSKDGTVRVWNCRTGEEKHCFNGLGAVVYTVALSPDGGQALLASIDNMVRLYDCATGQELYAFQGHSGSVDHLAFSSDGKMALSGSYDKSVRLWDCRTGKTLFCFSGHHDAVGSVAFSLDGKTALSSDLQNCIKSFKIDRQTIHKANVPSSYGKTLTVSFDGRLALSGDEQDSQNNTIHLWDCKTGQKLRSFRQQNSAPTSATVECLALSPDGGIRAVSGESNGFIRLWSCETGEEYKAFRAHKRRTSRVSFSQDGTQIITAGDDSDDPQTPSHSIKVWNSASGDEQKCWHGHTAEISALATSPKHTWVLSGGEDNVIQVWDCATAQKRISFSGHAGVAGSTNFGIRSVSLSEDGGRALSAGRDKKICYWNPSDGTVIHSLQLSDYIYDATLSPNGKWAVISSSDLVVRIWDCEQDQLVYSRKFEYGIQRVQFLSNGKEILFLTQQQSLYLWEFFDESGTLNPSMKWTTAHPILSAHALNAEGATGLTDADRELLKQLGTHFANN